MTQTQAPDSTTGLDWIEVGPLMAIPPLGARVVRHPSGEIAVFRNREDEVFALRNHCPHRGGPLSEGIVCERRVYCPLHNWGIALETGSALAPDEGETACFPTRVDNGTVFIGLPGSGGSL